LGVLRPISKRKGAHFMSNFDHTGLRARVLGRAEAPSCNEGAAELARAAILGGEAVQSADGTIVARTGIFTGRSAKDKYIVRDAATADTVWWQANNAMTPAQFSALLEDFEAACDGRPLHVQELFAGADPAHRLGVTVITETAWHALFIRNLLIRQADGPGGAGEVTILHLPSFRADPGRHGTRSETVVALDMSRRLVLIGGTAYAGEVKKAVFSLFNFLAPERDVLPMHCSANIGPVGDSALFFGLSGTGKTTLSSDPGRQLIGDDEHGWSATGIFNLEGGCYAKTIRLSAEAEPAIHAAARRAGTVLENVVLGADGTPDFDDGSLTENTRAAYPLEALDNVAPGGVGPVPKTVILLTCDAFGVLPPIARLTAEQAVYHFLSGYTAKVAGTERGVTEPQATFSVCFGAPFMARAPRVYGQLFADRLRESGATVWLVNTGWTGGGYGMGQRIDIATSRRLVAAALSGELETAPTRTDPVFALRVPKAVTGLKASLLDPRQTWADGAAYDRQARHLLALFEENFRTLGEAPAPRIAAE
jgi:phosphoenolpyruvate carboxykinase (ATP)